MFSTKHYLCCIVLALCVSGSAYANNGLGTRIKQEAVSKFANSKLGRKVMAGILGAAIACSGCGTNPDIVNPTETETELVQTAEVTETVETVEVTDLYDGDSIIFEQGGTIYDGLVLEGVSEDEVLVRLADGSEDVININLITGTFIADHPDIGIEVVLMGDRNKGEELLYGKIGKVADNGVRKIELSKVQFLDGRREMLDDIRFVHKDADFFEDGGYMTNKEFVDFIANGNNG